MDSLDQASGILKKGGVVVYPTETVYGLGCLLTFPTAIERVYQIKNRDATQPTSVLVESVDQAAEYVNFYPAARRLARVFWPGALTICLPVKRELPGAVLGPGNTLGVRVSGHEWARKLVEASGAPILAPSANFKGVKPPYTWAEIDKKLMHLVDYVVDIAPGGEKPSTVVIFESETSWKTVREGQITTAMLATILAKGT